MEKNTQAKLTIGQKLQLSTQSQNAQGSYGAILIFIITAIWSGLTAMGVEFGITAEQALELATSGDVMQIILVGLSSVLVPNLKMIKNGGWTLANLKNAWAHSDNFRKDIVVVLVGAAGCVGLNIDPQLVSQLFGFLSGDSGMGIAGIMTLIQGFMSIKKISNA